MDEISENSLSLVVTNNYSRSNIGAYSSNKYNINRCGESNPDSEYVEFKFTMIGYGTIEFKSINTQGNSRYVSIKIFNDEVLILTDNVASSSGVDKKYDLEENGTYKVRFYGTSTMTSNTSFESLTIIYIY